METVTVTARAADPWHNLALEEALLESAGERAVLYLWQNQNTVVIGRNQNAWRECRSALLESEGGKLARRSSGGGAVFHDLGNLNYTVILPRALYDAARIGRMLKCALAGCGIEAFESGRNDLILAGGEKFSGAAYQFTAGRALQHGTLLVSADMEKLGRYLAPSPLKLKAKGVLSVRSRVKNLCEEAPGLTVPLLCRAVADSFAEEFGPGPQVEEKDLVGSGSASSGERMSHVFSLDPSRVEELEKKYASWEWRYGETPRFDLRLEERFDWGTIELLISVRSGIAETVRVFTDAMDETLSERAERLLAGSRLTASALARRAALLGGLPGRDLAAWLKGIGPLQM
ncbi:MAG: lipoate--protein ligase [Lachnospiraceae bacterium]|nr:lipoate--protein ligase [Lachnospiraceae bacterium]